MNRRSEKRKRWRKRLAERAASAETWEAMAHAWASTIGAMQRDLGDALDQLVQAKAAAQYWQDRYQCLGAVLHVTEADQKARARLLELDAVPRTEEALTHKFAGRTLYQWATLPDELTAFFAMHEAVHRWRAQIAAAPKTLTLFRGGKSESLFVDGPSTQQ